MAETIKFILDEIRKIKEIVGGIADDEYFETDEGQLSLFVRTETKANKS